MLKGGKALLALMGLACVSMASAAMAEDAPYATFDIRLENNPVQAQVEPIITTPVTKGNVAFRIVNNTGRAAYFINGTEKQYIPVVSESTVTVPFSSNAYEVVDSEGKKVASWRFASEAKSSAVSSASQAQFAQWDQQIQQVLAASQNRSYSYDAKSENNYHPVSHPETKTVTKTQKNTIIRGFW